MQDVAPTRNERLRPVIFAPGGRDQELICALLARRGVDCEACASEEEFLASLTEECGPVLVTAEGLSRAGVQRFVALLDAQPDWSDLPVLLLIGGASAEQARLEALVGRPGVRWLRRPLDQQTLITVTETALEVRRRQIQVRNLLTNLRALNKALTHRTAQLQKLASALTEAKEEERRRLADVLHEDLQQTLVAAKLHADMARMRLTQNESAVRSVEQIMSLLDDAVQTSRNLSYELFPPALKDSQLAEALHWLRDVKRQNLGLEVSVSVAPDVGCIGEQLTKVLYRAAQELLRNVDRHAGVDEARIDARRDGHEIEVVVSDRGRGFDVAAAAKRDVSSGFGLFSVREHLESFGGSLRIESAPGEGSRFTLRLPLTGVAETAADSAAASAG